jgi:hypothetical protein
LRKRKRKKRQDLMGKTCRKESETRRTFRARILEARVALEKLHTWA